MASILAAQRQPGQLRQEETGISTPSEEQQRPPSGNEQPALPVTDKTLKDLAKIFQLLSDQTRLRILLYLLQQRELHVRALCKLIGQTQPAVSHHLALLRNADLIEPRREGKHNYYRILPDRFREIVGIVFSLMPESEGEVRFQDITLSQDSEPREAT